MSYNDNKSIYINKIKNYNDNNNVYKLYKYITKLLILDIKGGDEIYSSFLVYVYNKYMNIIEIITKKIYQKNIDEFILIDDYKLLSELTIENNKNILSTIEKNGVHKIYHVSIYPLEEFVNTHENENSWVGVGNNTIYKNPIGLWVSCGNSWQKYIGDTPNQWSIATYIYEVSLSNSVLYIHNIKEFEKFINTYKNNDKFLDIKNVINWKKVKEDYDGLIICPYLGDEIWGKDANNFQFNGDPVVITNYITNIVGVSWKKKLYFLAEWYRHWETSSGVIWKKSGIKNIILIKKLKTFDDIPLKIKHSKNNTDNNNISTDNSNSTEDSSISTEDNSISTKDSSNSNISIT